MEPQTQRNTGQESRHERFYQRILGPGSPLRTRVWIGVGLSVVIAGCLATLVDDVTGWMVRETGPVDILFPGPVDKSPPKYFVDMEEFNPHVLLDPVRPIVDPEPVPSVEVSEDLIRDYDLVLGVVVEGMARAYPINMLTGPDREIVNDSLGGKRIAATW